MTAKKKTAAAEVKPAKAAAKAPVAAQAPVKTPAALQMEVWVQAVRNFSQGRFAEALRLFSEVAKGPARDVADKARTYIQVCERRMGQANMDLRTAEDHFNYGVERLNARDFEKARTHLGRAATLDPAGEHILYTLALCCGLTGDQDGAFENLRRAIELEPRNRVIARQDPEFAPLVQQLPSLRMLLGSDGPI